MIFANAIRLQVEPLAAIVKIGDTLVDIEEGFRAGRMDDRRRPHRNMIGLSSEDFASLPSAEQQRSHCGCASEAHSQQAPMK